jgi:hypothetical protein
MSTQHNLFGTLQSFDLGNGQSGKFYSLPALEAAGVGPISRLPVSIRLVLESVLRNYDDKKVSEANVKELANWKANEARTAEIPFGGDAFRCGQARQESQDHRTARAGGSRRRSLGAGGCGRLGRFVRAEPGD